MDQDRDEVSRHEVLNPEPSAWLRGAIRDRLAELAPAMLPNMFGVIALALTDPDEAADPAREDRSCDRCRAYVPPGTTFYTAMTDMAPAKLGWPWSRLLAGYQILVAYGLCVDCTVLEVGPLDQLTEAHE